MHSIMTADQEVGISLTSHQGEGLIFEDYYKIKQRLAKGSYGTVFVTEHIATKHDYAVKVIERSRLSAKDKDLVQREVSIMKDCRDVENVVKLVDYFVAPDTYYVVQDFAQGGKISYFPILCVASLVCLGKIFCFLHCTYAFR